MNRSLHVRGNDGRKKQKGKLIRGRPPTTLVCNEDWILVVGNLRKVKISCIFFLFMFLHVKLSNCELIWMIAKRRQYIVVVINNQVFCDSMSYSSSNTWSCLLIKNFSYLYHCLWVCLSILCFWAYLLLRRPCAELNALPFNLCHLLSLHLCHLRLFHLKVIWILFTYLFL